MATHALGYCYDVGIGVDSNSNEAERLYRLAVRRGVEQAAYNLSVLGRERGDERFRLRWLRRAADMGDIEAVLELAALAIEAAWPMERARPLMKRLKQIARREEDPDALEAKTILASAYGAGVGVRRSLARQRKYLDAGDRRKTGVDGSPDPRKSSVERAPERQ